MGLLDFLSPALTVATQAAGAYQGAQANAASDRRQQAIQALTLAKQEHDQQIKDALAQSQTDYYKTRSDALAHPPEKPHHYTLVPSQGPNGEGRYVKLDETTGEVAPTDAGLKPPAPTREPTAHYTVTPITAPDGTVHLARVNTMTGEVTDTGVLGKQPTPTQHGGLAAVSDARLATAAQQATDADARMTAFEQSLASGHQQIPGMGLYLAKRALQSDPAVSTIAETALNEQYPQLAEYVRAAKAVASAERLISPRGGSNALMQAEAALSAGGAHASPGLIAQAQAYRKALVHGLTQHGGTQPGAATAPNAGGSGAPAKQPITAQEAAALKQLGHTDADIAAHYVVTGGSQ